MIEILLIVLLFIKHAVADLYLQTFHIPGHKTDYFGKAHRHYLEHGIGTFIVIIFFTAWPLALAISLLDYLLHWHIDFGKSMFVQKKMIKRDSKVFWRIQCLDQIAHYLTYGLIAFLVLQYGF